MGSAYQNRFVKLKKYEDNLRQSMKTFDKLFQKTSFGSLYNNSISYQFKHWQLKKEKRSCMYSLIKKSSLAHLITISTHSRKISELTAQDLSKEIKIKKKVLLEKTEVFSGIHRKRKLTPDKIQKKVSKDQRPHTVSINSLRKKSTLQSQSRLSPSKLKPGHVPYKSLDSEISPW